MSNCSDEFPTSEVYFAEISTEEKVGVILTSVVVVAVIGLFLDQARYILRKYPSSAGKDPQLKATSLWLIGIYPVFSIMALLAVIVPRAVLICDLASSVYLAVCLFHFTTLIIVYAGGVPSLLNKVENHKGGFTLRTPPCCCCCFCCPMVKPTWTNLRRIRLMVFQHPFIEPSISFITVLLWTDDKYQRGDTGPDKANMYLAVPRSLSTVVALYGLLILFWSSTGFLTRHGLRRKFFLMKIVLFLHNFQDFIFISLAKGNVPPCTGHMSSNVRGDAMRHMVVVGEMFLLALLARCLYRRPHAQHLEEDFDNDDDTTTTTNKPSSPSPSSSAVDSEAPSVSAAVENGVKRMCEMQEVKL
ncbi:organic solute transporter subunit alpha-like isoform X2 [Babylonia areolata]|uniref:organic solute transporter subunit alpha-like isoform X2 n=1 Tax=Babylonia areolata TaxID=304850 RepID=UPI003FD19BE2